MTNQVNPGFNIDDVHRSVLDELVGEYGLDMFLDAERTAIARCWHSLDAWPDFPAALERLRRSYIAVSFTILSVSLIIATARRNGLHWDAVISCEMLKVYKPRPEAYQQAAKLLQLEPGAIMMVACHNFDLDAARGAGYRTCFVRRPDEWGPAGPPDPDTQSCERSDSRWLRTFGGTDGHIRRRRLRCLRHYPPGRAIPLPRHPDTSHDTRGHRKGGPHCAGKSSSRVGMNSETVG